jgi:hypothetical protein
MPDSTAGGTNLVLPSRQPFPLMDTLGLKRCEYTLCLVSDAFISFDYRCVARLKIDLAYRVS